MTGEISLDEVPQYLLEGLQGRDLQALKKGMFIKFQYISRAPTRGTNFRYVLMDDGSLYWAKNSDEETNDIFNTPLSKEPARILNSEEIAEVLSKIKESQFFKQSPYHEIRARDGAIIIVTANLRGKTHEVWYVNINTPLTDYLFALPAKPNSSSSEMDDLKSLKDLLARQQQELDDYNKQK